MKLRIDGHEYVLSQRRAADVLELAVAVGKQDAARDGIDHVLSMSQIIRDSLKATYRTLGRIRGFRYRKFTQAGGVVHLLDSLSIDEIGEACRYIIEDLEGSKKKVTEAGSASGATSPAG